MTELLGMAAVRQLIKRFRSNEGIEACSLLDLTCDGIMKALRPLYNSAYRLAWQKISDDQKLRSVGPRGNGAVAIQGVKILE